MGRRRGYRVVKTLEVPPIPVPHRVPPFATIDLRVYVPDNADDNRVRREFDRAVHELRVQLPGRATRSVEADTG